MSAYLVRISTANKRLSKAKFGVKRRFFAANRRLFSVNKRLFSENRYLFDAKKGLVTEKWRLKANSCLQWLEKASLRTPNISKFADLSGAATTGLHHFVRILDWGLKANRGLKWLEKTSPQCPYLKISLSFQGPPPLDRMTSQGYWIGAWILIRGSGRFFFVKRKRRFLILAKRESEFL